MADQVLKYSISGDSSGATAAFKDVAAAIQRTEDKADKFASSVDKLKESFQRQVAGMSQHSAAIERQVAGMGQAGGATSSLVSGMSSLSGAVGLVTGAFAAYGAMEVAGWIKNQAAAAIEYGAGLQDLSDRLGLSTDRLQVYGTWAELSGTSTEVLAKSIAKLETNIAKGDKELASFGITALDADAAFMQVVAAVERAPSQFEKARIAEAAFGKGWAELMPVLNAGSASLKEMADNASVIDPESIRRMAEMDDQLTELKQSFRMLGVEITAAFGPAFIATIDYATRKIRELHDTVADENTEGSIANIQKLGNDPRLELMGWSALNSGAKNREIIESVAEMDRSNALMQKANDLAGSQREQREAAARLDQDRQKEANDKKAEIARKAAVAELGFQREMAYQLALLQATADQRELIALDQKYATLREKHKANKESILAIEMAHQAELQNYHMQRNFQRMGQERDSEAPGEGEQNTWWADSGKAFLSARGETYESYSMRNPGGTSVDSASAEAARSKATSLALEQPKEDMEDLEKSWQRLADSIAERASGELAPAIIAVFRGGDDALSKFGDAAGNIMEGLLQDTAKLIIQWLILKALSSAMGGGAEGPGGLGGFLMKGMGGGHADGTLSSPGGLKYLGERGPEPYETPYGQRGIATYGLYQVPAGTRVQSAGSGASIGAKEFHLHTTEADPIQVGEIFRRVVREEIVLHEASVYRDRSQIT